MDNIHKLPYILGASVTIIVGMSSYNSGFEPKIIYIRMSISMIIFFVVGIYLRGVLIKIDTEIKEKKAEQEIQEKLELERLKGNDEEGSEEEGIKSKIDYRIDDNDFNSDIDINSAFGKLYDEEFSPLSVNSIKVDKEKK